ncbi:tail fiber assembly protein, partial [Enterobacter asburiae]
MNNYVYSRKNNAFYAVSLKEAYEMAGAWPDDSLNITDEMFTEFTASAPEGKVRVAGDDGRPAWADIPPQTPEQIQAQAEKERQRLLTNAISFTDDWRTELSLGIISDEDKAKLAEWMKYIKAVKEIDTSNPADINWPARPA